MWTKNLHNEKKVQSCYERKKNVSYGRTNKFNTFLFVVIIEKRKKKFFFDTHPPINGVLKFKKPFSLRLILLVCEFAWCGCCCCWWVWFSSCCVLDLADGCGVSDCAVSTEVWHCWSLKGIHFENFFRIQIEKFIFYTLLIFIWRSSIFWLKNNKCWLYKVFLYSCLIRKRLVLFYKSI